MKKKITQWFIGLVVSMFGLGVCSVAYGCGYAVIGMVTTVGRQSVGYFLVFIFCLLLFLLLPYLMFKIVEEGIADKYKDN